MSTPTIKYSKTPARRQKTFQREVGTAGTAHCDVANEQLVFGVVCAQCGHDTRTGPERNNYKYAVRAFIGHLAEQHPHSKPESLTLSGSS